MSLAKKMQYMGSGDLAALRRLDMDFCLPIYWRLAASHSELAKRKKHWVPVVRALALLSEKGPPGARSALHDGKRKFGMMLCDGGVPGWSGHSVGGQTAKPVLSERRLAQLLAARGEQRSVLLTRAVRAVAARRAPSLGVDVPDLTWSFLNPNSADQVARAYYQCLDGAEQSTMSNETEINDE